MCPIRGQNPPYVLHFSFFHFIYKEPLIVMMKGSENGGYLSRLAILCIDYRLATAHPCPEALFPPRQFHPLHGLSIPQSRSIHPTTGRLVPNFAQNAKYICIYQNLFVILQVSSKIGVLYTRKYGEHQLQKEQ